MSERIYAIANEDIRTGDVLTIIDGMASKCPYLRLNKPVKYYMNRIKPPKNKKVLRHREEQRRNRQ